MIDPETTTTITTVTETKKKSPKMLIISVVLILLAIGLSVAATFWYLSNHSELLTSNQTTAGAKMCTGVKIVYFPGGNETDSFASVVYKGAQAAESALGPSVKYVWSDWDPDKMVTQFKDAINELPDAIAIMGHPGSDALRPLVDEAERKNIIVTLQNVDLPDIREKYVSKGFGYAGQSLYDSGFSVGSAVIRKYQPAAGAEAVVFGVDPLKSPSRYERTKGIIDGLEKGNLVVHEILIPLEVEKDTASAAAQKMFSDALTLYPNTKIMVTDHGAVTASAPVHLKNIGKNPGEIIVAGFDLSVDTVEGIKSGYIGLILDQQPYLQGYLPILQVCLTKKYGLAGLYIDTGVGLIDSSNVDLVAELAEQKIR